MFRDFRFYRELEREKRINPDYEGQVRDLRQAKWGAFRREVKNPLYVLAAVVALGGTLYLDNKSSEAQEMDGCIKESRREKSPLECIPGLINFSRP